MTGNATRAARMGCSADLVAGIRRYDERIARLGGYGTRIRARARVSDGPMLLVRSGGELLDGSLIELGYGGCQPGLLTADGRRYAIDLDSVGEP